MQQARLDELDAQEALNEASWNAHAHAQEELQENGWCAWTVIPPPYSGFSFRTFFSMMGRL